MIWTILYWILLTFAITAMAYALFWNRPGWRGRPKLRCRKCFYDLTTTPGDPKSGPIQCPECGKKHHSNRSMRKTKRSKKWIGIALVLLVAWHSVRVSPAVKQRGWWAAVPSWALVLSIHKTPRHIKDPSLEWGSIAYGRDTPLERAMMELHVRARVEGLSWFEYQLVAWMARTESEEQLSQSDKTRYEGVSPRASGYDILIERGINSGMLGNFHRDWYRRVFHVEVQVRETWPENAHIYAELNARTAYMDRDPKRHFVPALRMHIENGFTNSYTRKPNVGGWELDPFLIGGVRNVLIRGDIEEQANAIYYDSIWNDNKIFVPVSRKSGTGSISVNIYEISGYMGSPLDTEELVDSREVAISVERNGVIEDFVQIIDSEDAREEIERCLQAEAVYWFDMDGRWHAMFKFELVNQPRNLGHRRYTFGGSLRSLSPNEGLTGQAWWALEPDEDGDWKLIHGGEYVPMYGWADETIQDDRFPNLTNLRIKTDPNYCLRDDDASIVVGGRLRWQVKWKQAMVHTH